MYCHVFENTHVLSCIFKYFVILIYGINQSLFIVVGIKSINNSHNKYRELQLNDVNLKKTHCSINFNHFRLGLLISSTFQ